MRKEKLKEAIKTIKWAAEGLYADSSYLEYLVPNETIEGSSKKLLNELYGALKVLTDELKIEEVKK